MSSLPPQVIKQPSGSYALLNVDVEPLSTTQRVGIAVLIWDQVQTLMIANGEYKPRDPSVLSPSGIGAMSDIDTVAASLVRVKRSHVHRLRPRLFGDNEMLRRVMDGEFDTVLDIERAMGFKKRSTIAEGRKSQENKDSLYFGKGDKFDEATEPLARYLRGWENRGFAFTHVNPREASRRLQRIDEVTTGLAKAREDLERRSHVARLSTPSR